MTREQLETQLTEMWDAVSGITGDEAHEAIEQAYLIEDKMRKQFDDQEKIRDAATDLLEALESMAIEFSRPDYELFCDHSVGICSCAALGMIEKAKETIKKARGL